MPRAWTIPLSCLLATVTALLLPATSLGTTPTAPVGTVYTASLSAVNEGSITFDTPSEFTTISCGKSTFEASLQTHGAGVTAKAPINSLLFTECGSIKAFKVIANGSLEFHVIDGYSTVTWSGGEFTVEKETVFGLLHCVLGTNSTDIGTLANPSGDSEHAVLGLEGKTIPVIQGSEVLCGTGMQITGSYLLKTPTGLRFDRENDPKATLTSPSGTTYSGSISAENEGKISLFGGGIECGSSSFSGAVELQGSIPASGTLSSLSFAECVAIFGSKIEVKVLKRGSFEIRSTGSGNGTLVSSGTELTISLFGSDCVFRTHNTDLGAVTAAASNSGHAVLDISSSIRATPRCGEATSMKMEGAYKFTSPTGLRVD